MRYLKSYKLFENSEENPNHGIVRDALSDLTDEGFDVVITDDEEYKSQRMMIVTISRPGTEHNRQTLMGFNIKDVVNSVEELKSHLSDDLSVKSIYYHIKGYEPSTWYGLSNALFKDLPKEPIDKISIEFIGVENWK